MKTIFKSTAIIGAALSLSVCLTTGAAGADPTDTGWDDKVDQIVGSGSDTTYRVFGDLATAYNQANGCEVATADTGTPPAYTPPLAGDCKLGASQIGRASCRERV